MTAPVDLLAASDVLLGALRESPNLDVFEGAPASVRFDSGNRALPYACLYLGADFPDLSVEDLCGDPGSRTLPFQVTVASGYLRTTLRAAQKVQAGLSGRWLLPGSGRVRMRPAGTIQEDRDVTPSRWFIPLQFYVEIG